MSNGSKLRLPRRIEDYPRVVFDCDGVILDSNGLKSEMMGRALDGEPHDKVEEFVAYHRATGGVSRYVKFDHFYTAILPVADKQPRVAAALERYAALLQEGLRSCPELPGIRSVLDRLGSAGVPCYVNSGGDETEVRTVLTERGLGRYFAGIFGSPRTKTENLARIEGIDVDGGLFIGDARSDLDAASVVGLDFVFVAERSEWEDGRQYCAAHDIPAIAFPGNIGEVEPGDGR